MAFLSAWVSVELALSFFFSSMFITYLYWVLVVAHMIFSF